VDPTFGGERIEADRGVDGTKRLPNKLSPAVFGGTKGAVNNMVSKANCIDSPRDPRCSDDGAAEWGPSPPEPPDGGPREDYPAMLDQGLRLNRAFVKISNPLIREAIVNLVSEAAKNENGAEIPTFDQIQLQDRPAKSELSPSGRGRGYPSY
jgi:hypothetical protein